MPRRRWWRLAHRQHPVSRPSPAAAPPAPQRRGKRGGRVQVGACTRFRAAAQLGLACVLRDGVPEEVACPVFGHAMPSRSSSAGCSYVLRAGEAPSSPADAPKADENGAAPGGAAAAAADAARTVSKLTLVAVVLPEPPESDAKLALLVTVPSPPPAPPPPPPLSRPLRGLVRPGSRGEEAATAPAASPGTGSALPADGFSLVPCPPPPASSPVLAEPLRRWRG
jgi:hypothetical protein